MNVQMQLPMQHATASELLNLARQCNPTRQAVGRLGELLVHEAMTAAGYLSWLVSNPGDAPGDVAAIDTDTGVILHIEVKTSRRSIDNKWRCTLRKKGKADHRGADCVVLLCVNGDVTAFVVSVRDIKQRVQICITSNPKIYAGRWSKYRCPLDQLASRIVEVS